MSKNVIKAITLTSIDSATLVLGAYAPINVNGLDEACSIVTIDNATTQNITISLDGINHHIFVKSGSTYWLPAQMANHPNSLEALIAKGTIFYARGAAGVGFVYLSGFYV